MTIASPRPDDPRNPSEVDAKRGETSTVRADASPIAVPTDAIRRRPSELRDRGDARKGEILVVLPRDERLCPQRRCDAEDRAFAHAGQQRERIPIVRLLEIDQPRPAQ